MTLRSARTAIAHIMEMMMEMVVTTAAEKAADFGCLLPSSLLTLTLLAIQCIKCSFWFVSFLFRIIKTYLVATAKPT